MIFPIEAAFYLYQIKNAEEIAHNHFIKKFIELKLRLGVSEGDASKRFLTILFFKYLFFFCNYYGMKI